MSSIITLSDYDTFEAREDDFDELDTKFQPRKHRLNEFPDQGLYSQENQNYVTPFDLDIIPKAIDLSDYDTFEAREDDFDGLDTKFQPRKYRLNELPDKGSNNSQDNQNYVTPEATPFDLDIKPKALELSQNAIQISDDESISKMKPDTNNLIENKLNMNWLYEIADVLHDYQTKPSRIQEDSNLETNLNIWYNKLLEFLARESNDATLALVLQNFASLFVLKWHLSDGDPYNSFSIGHRILSSSLGATSKWITANDFERAQLCHNMAGKFAEYLEDSIEIMEDMTATERLQLAEEQFVFLTTAIEILHWKGEFNEVNRYLKLVSPMVQTENQAKYLACLTYNLSIHDYNCGDFQSAINWLKEAFDFCEQCTQSDDLKLQILELVGETYLEMDAKTYWMSAGNAFEKAFDIKPKSDILISQAKCVLQGGKTSDLKQFIDTTVIPRIDILNSTDMEKILSMMIENNQTELAHSLLTHSLCQTKTTFPYKMLTLLRENRTRDAEILLENWEEHDFNEELVQLVLRQTLNSIFANKSADKWIFYSLRAVQSVQDQDTEFRYEEISNLLQKQICYIHIENGEIHEAKESYKAIRFDQMHQSDLYLQMKMTLVENRSEEFLAIVSNLSDTALGLYFQGEISPMVLACSAAMDLASDEIVEICVKNLLSNKLKNPIVNLYSHRYLTRLTLNNQNELTLTEINELVDQARLFIEPTKQIVATYNPVILWYERKFWNLALKADNLTDTLSILLKCCDLLVETDKVDPAASVRRNTVYLHTIAVSLTLLRTNQGCDNDQIVKSALRLCEQLKQDWNTYGGVFNRLKQQTNRILFLYEFELNSFWMSQSELHTMWQQTHSQFDFAYSKILIGILMERGTQYLDLMIKIILTTIPKGFHKGIIIEDIITLYNYFLKILKSNDLTEEKIHTYLDQLVQIVCKYHDFFTENELERLTIICWNSGVLCLSERERISEGYFKLSLKLAGQRGLEKSVYREKVNDLYQFISKKPFRET